MTIITLIHRLPDFVESLSTGDSFFSAITVAPFFHQVNQESSLLRVTGIYFVFPDGDVRISLRCSPLVRPVRVYESVYKNTDEKAQATFEVAIQQHDSKISVSCEARSILGRIARK